MKTTRLDLGLLKDNNQRKEKKKYSQGKNFGSVKNKGINRPKPKKHLSSTHKAKETSSK